MDVQTIKSTLASKSEITKDEYDKAKSELSDGDFSADYLSESIKILTNNTAYGAPPIYKDSERYYKINNLSDSDVNLMLSHNINEHLGNISRGVNIIKSIIIAFTVLSIIGASVMIFASLIR